MEWGGKEEEQEEGNPSTSSQQQQAEEEVKGDHQPNGLKMKGRMRDTLLVGTNDGFIYSCYVPENARVRLNDGEDEKGGGGGVGGEGGESGGVQSLVLKARWRTRYPLTSMHFCQKVIF